MARAETLLYGPLGWSVVHAPAAATLALATKAGVPNLCHVISGYTISANGVPAAAVLVTLKDGANVLDQFYLPAAAFAPIVVEYKRCFVCTPGNLAEMAIPSLGGAISASVTLRGMTSTQ